MHWYVLTDTKAGKKGIIVICYVAHIFLMVDESNYPPFVEKHIAAACCKCINRGEISH